MAGGYRYQPLGIPAYAERLRSYQRQIDAIRSTGNLKVPADGGTATTPPPSSNTDLGQIWPHVVDGLKLDGLTDDATAIIAALDAMEDGKTPGTLVVTGKAGSIGYLNQTITLSKNGCALWFDPAVRWFAGPDFRLRAWGTIPETPTTNAEKPALVEDAPAGATELKVQLIPDSWVPGIFVGIRGRRTASGSVPNSEIFRVYVSALDRVNNVITIATGLPKAFVVVNDTTWSNKATQITKITMSRLTGTPELGETVLECEDTSIFQVGSVIQIQDDKHTIDRYDAIRTGNFAHKECNQVAEIIDGTRLKLSAPLEHTYDLTLNGRVTLLNALEDAQIRGLRLGFREQQALGQHAIEIRYALNTHVVDCHITGGGDGGVSWSNHAIRTTDSLLCSTQRCVISNPSHVQAARGYGITWYGATGCWSQDCSVTGARHSFLWFNGASSCWAINCQSTDDRTSAYDWHGAEENNNRTLSCAARGGTRRTDDSEGNRAAWKFGNPSQTNGSRANQAVNCLVVNYHGAAVQGLPRSGANLWQGIVRKATIGIKLTSIPGNDVAVQDGFTVRDSTFEDVRAPLEIDGGPNGVVHGVTIQDTTFTRCGPLQLKSAPGARLDRVVIQDPVDPGWQIMAWDCDNIAVVNSDLSGSPKGLALTGCAGARVTGNRLHDLAGPVWHDGGGNDGALFRSNEVFPGDGTFTRTAAASTGITQQAMTDAGTEVIGPAVTGTTWIDPETLVGGDGTTLPGTGGGSTTPPPPVGGGGDGNGFPLANRSGLPWNSGFFHGGGNAGDATGSAATDLRSRPMDVYETFVGRASWAEMGSIDGSWAAWSNIGILVITLPFAPGSTPNSQTASGDNNTWWRNYALALKMAGINLTRTVIRLAWEQNGDWYPHAWGKPENEPAEYVAAFKNVAASMREVVDGLWFSSNLNKNNKRPGTDWRGVLRQLKGYADIVGLDCYDMYNASRNAAEWAANMLNQDPGLTSVADFCRDEGFLMAIEEWAPVVAGGADGTGGGDNPYYIHAMFAWLTANADVLAYEVFYDHVGTNDYNHKMNGPPSEPASYKPNALAAYRSHYDLVA